MADAIDSYRLASPACSSSSLTSSPSSSSSVASPASVPRPLSAHRPRPIPNSYWATPLLLACEYPWAPGCATQKLDALLLAGVRSFIDLTEPGELRPYAACALASRAAALGIPPASIAYANFPIPDRALPSSRAYMCAILAALARARDTGAPCAVHCRGGIGRTGMVVGCWLVQSGIARDGAHALTLIAHEWKSVEKVDRYPHSPETGPQFEFVKNFRPRCPITCG